jgi:thiazole biosynthesis enzyme
MLHERRPRQIGTNRRRSGMSLDELKVTRAIIDRFNEKLKSALDLDVAVVGGGPSGMVASYFLAKRGHRVALFERKLSMGGGMWGGGMMFNQIVVQEAGKRLLDHFDIRAVPYEGQEYFTADAVEAVSLICARAVQSGVKMFNCFSVEDVVVRNERVCGLVVNWSPVEAAGLHVDPLAIHARSVIDATGHATEVIRVIEGKMGAKLLTPSGRIEGEKSLWVEIAETTTLENTQEAYPGVFVTGMAANATFGSYRMGPIFGGMLLSGERVAELVDEKLGRGSEDG